MADKPTPIKKAVEPESPFDTEVLEIRGQRFVVRELSSKQYDKCVALATDPKTQDVDSIKLLRWMLLEAVIEPEGFNADSLNELSFKTSRELSKVVNDIHFPPPPEDEKDEDEDPNE